MAFSPDGTHLAAGGDHGDLLQLGRLAWTSTAQSLEQKLCGEVRGESLQEDPVGDVRAGGVVPTDMYCLLGGRQNLNRW